MAAELVGAIQGDQRGNGDEAPVALGQARTLPHVSKEHIGREFSQFGGNFLLHGAGLSHDISFCMASGL